MKRYGDIPLEYARETARVVILPIPYDGTSTWIKGADKGPEALLEASANMELYDIETDTEVYLKGIYTAPPVLEKSSPEKMVEAVYRAAGRYVAEGKFVVGLGGEHSVTYGQVKAYFDNFPAMSVLQLDAHTDLRGVYEGSPYNHACVMARVQELCPIVQVGIRSMDVGEKKRLNPERVFWAHRVHGSQEWWDKAVGLLSDDVFITIDLDVFDPAILPSTGTPEPGGLLWYETLAFLKYVISKKNVIGFDIVELCPSAQSPSSDFLAAKLVYKLLSYKF
ncbi:MAG: agmatinase [Bacteroidetes bacterium]|nr:agmatinase [Bacteroidota bacterium]